MDVDEVHDDDDADDDDYDVWEVKWFFSLILFVVSLSALCFLSSVCMHTAKKLKIQSESETEVRSETEAETTA